MAKRALIIRHAEPETLAANYTSALVERGFELRALNVFEGAPGSRTSTRRPWTRST